MAAHGTPSLLSGATMQHFPEIQLTIQEARVLGCLLEKQILTSGSYPLTHNSLLIACNQTSSRDPITHFTGEEVAEALRGLLEKYLVEKTLGFGESVAVLIRDGQGHKSLRNPPRTCGLV